MRLSLTAADRAFVLIFTTSLLSDAKCTSVGSAISETCGHMSSLRTNPPDRSADQLLLQLQTSQQLKLVMDTTAQLEGDRKVITNTSAGRVPTATSRSSKANSTAEPARFEVEVGDDRTLNPRTRDGDSSLALEQDLHEVHFRGEAALGFPALDHSSRIDNSTNQTGTASLISRSSGVSKQANGEAGHGAVNPSTVKDVIGDSWSWLGPRPVSTKAPLDANGASGLGAMAELRLHGVTLRYLHSMVQGSLARFLRNIRLDLSSGARVPEHRVNILGFHERYQRVSPSHWGAPTHTQEEVVVRFEILFGEHGNERPEPHEALDFLKADFLSEVELKFNSGLHMSNATIEETLDGDEGFNYKDTVHRRDSTRQFSAVAVPIGISAMIICVLVWLAVA